MPFKERANIISNLTVVDAVTDFEDDELGSCSLALEKIKKEYPEDEIIFCNGGDRKAENIPESMLSEMNLSLDELKKMRQLMWKFLAR